jgi:hypothetical protein
MAELSLKDVVQAENIGGAISPIQFLSYNGVILGPDSTTPGESKIYPPKFNVRSEFVYDESGRTVMYTRYFLDVTTIVHAGKSAGSPGSDEANTAEAIETMRRNLSEPGRELRIKGLGFGDLIINSSPEQQAPTALQQLENFKRDYFNKNRASTNADPITIFDAFPRLIAFRPLGAGLAYEVIWACEFNVAERIRRSSDGRVDAQVGLLSLNYSQSWTSDMHGWSTRVITGKARMPGTRIVGNKDALEAFRAQFQCLVPRGFRRTQATYTYSQDNREIDFNFTDEEVQTLPLPRGMIVFDVNESVRMAALQTSIYTLTISGTASTDLRTDPSAGAQKLIEYIFARVSQIKDAPTTQKSYREFQDRVIIPLDLSMSRKWGTRETRINIVLQVNNRTAEPFDAFGLFDEQGLANGGFVTSEAQWQEGMKATYQQYGPHQRVPAINQDTQVSPATGQLMATIGNSLQNRPRQRRERQLPFGCSVTKENSWLQLRSRMTGYRQDQVAVHQYSNSYAPGPYYNQGWATATPALVGHRTPGPTSLERAQTQVEKDYQELLGNEQKTLGLERDDETVEFMAAPSFRLKYEGIGIRIGFKPVVPPLKSIQGIELEPMTVLQHTEEIIGYLFGCKIYRVKWSQLFKVKGQLVISSKADPHAGMPNDGGIVNSDTEQAGEKPRGGR